MSESRCQPTTPDADVVVAGHICLDVIPTFEHGAGAARLAPGRLVRVGPALRSTGGAVSNVGLALHRLGVRASLVGKVGDDLFGSEVLRILRDAGPSLADGMRVVPGEQTSYTIVINPPGVDRTFLHCPGANDTFSADDVDYDALAGARLFHFGYPPVMRLMYQDGGNQLAEIFRRAKSKGVTTSLDTCGVDPQSKAGKVDWAALFQNVLPHVDLFLPSIDEIRHMLRLPENASPSEVGSRLLAMGPALVGLKLGDQGLYVRTTADRARMESAGLDVEGGTDSLLGRELLAPCYQARVVGTTGAGDCTIAGFLAALLHRQPLEQAMDSAVGVGACSVEKPDATSGVPPWEQVQAKITAGWPRQPLRLPPDGWKKTPRGQWAGPLDAR